MTISRDECIEILRDFAAKEPATGSEWLNCGCCDAEVESEPHLPQCPWLRAVELLAQG